MRLIDTTALNEARIAYAVLKLRLGTSTRCIQDAYASGNSEVIAGLQGVQAECLRSMSKARAKLAYHIGAIEMLLSEKQMARSMFVCCG